MTEIRFFFNAPDTLSATCRIVASACRQGRSVTVYAPGEGLARQLDTLLWTFQPLSFVPHVGAEHPLASETPVVLTDDPARSPHRDVLVNLDAGCPPGFADFSQVIEVVSTEEGDRARARQRWAAYKAQGFTLETNDLARPEPA